ncbi:MAG: radical SAM protein [Verrucomicrobiae bacterium]|nr:radical SAM protein [Verrucomicrobiae bacterium]
MNLIHRRERARERLPQAVAMLSECRYCRHECGVSRSTGQRGPCGAGTQTRFFSAQTEVSDERLFAPVYAIAFGGCDLRCSFCITGAQSWNARGGEIADVGSLVSKAEKALEAGARSLMILGGEPTVHLHTVLEMASVLPESAPLIYKSNGHFSAWAQQWLQGIFDVFLIDCKFGNDHCAERLAGIKNYTAILKENLRWAHRSGRLVIRHLVMPGHVGCCWTPVARWLSEELPGVAINLRTGFWPGWQSFKHAELRGGVSAAEANAAMQIAETHGLRLIS